MLVPTDVFYTSQLNAVVIQELEIKYPFLEIGIIGMSVLGNPIPYIKVGTGTKKVFYNAAFHANEWITTPVLLKFVEELAEAYITEKRLNGVDVNRLLRNVQLYVVPMVNPDGVDLVNGVIREVEVLRRTEEIAEKYPDIP